ncbi:MAG: flagellar type III secretion system pore protein FliP [Pseudomonadota bacterium]
MSVRRKAGLIPLAFIFILAMAGGAAAQSISIDLGEQSGTLTGRVVQLLLLLTVLSVAPSILITVTSFTRMVVVLSLLRSALGTQQSPPNMVLISLALFLTAFVMAPTFETAYRDGLQPLIEEQIGEEEAFTRTVAPFRAFMLKQVRDKDLALFLDMSGIPERPDKIEDVPLKALVPAFVVSELRRAFEIGFLLFIPFIVIDLVVSSVLMSMGMMMLPPIMISLPFKLIFFVLVDGWHLVAGSLVQSFGPG